MSIMTGLCPICNSLVESREKIEANKVYLEKTCPEHGTTKTLVSSDAKYWEWAMKYNRPGAKPFKWSSEIEHGCPDDCGICPAHKQHTCIGIIEITGRCNLECNVCFAGSPRGEDQPLQVIRDMVDSFVSHETDPEILQLSGGEPTLHPDLNKIVRYARDLGIEDVVVSTNGLRLLDEDFMEQFAKNSPVIYLQFDTFIPDRSVLIRGQDLVEDKLRVVKMCEKYDLTTVLVPTIIRGVNDDEIGEIVRFGMKQEKVFGVNFQPLAMTGRLGIDTSEPNTIPEILSLIEKQTGGVVEPSDFRPIPCPHPHCTAIGYFLVEDGDITPLTDLVDVDDFIDYAKDRSLASEKILMDQAFRDLFTTRAVPGTTQTVEAFCQACGITIPEVLKKSVKTIGVHAFMDRYNFQLERVQKCCIHLIQPDGKMIPFCNYNMFHRSGDGE